MKNLFYVAILLVLPTMSYSQPNSTASDQNIRYKESQDRYAKMIDSLVSWHGVTLQNTYKAYDWYEARQARRQQRRAWRHEERMANGYYYDNYYNNYDSYYNNAYYSNYRYGRYQSDRRYYPSSYYSPSYYSPSFYPSFNYRNRSSGFSIGVGFGW